MRPICAKCSVFFRCEKNDYAFEVGFGDGTHRPFTLWLGDLWRCPGCDTEIIVGAGTRPMATLHQDDFEKIRESHNPQLLVDP